MTRQRDNTGWRSFAKGMESRAGSESRHEVRTRAEERVPPGREPSLDRDNAASKYIRENFDPGDRVALIVINKRNGAVIQRLAKAESVAGPDTQRWLRYMNDDKNQYEVYISINTLKDDARGRTKEEIGTIRHIYLDLDHGGQEALDRLLARSDLPKPNYVLTSSPGKYQVVWKVEGFTIEQAETLQRGLARETGADPAATDSSRVLRLPGFYNHKYAPPHLVEVEKLSEQVQKQEQFPDYSELKQSTGPDIRIVESTQTRMDRGSERITQSERDWAYARRALLRGESKESVTMAIAAYRRFDKPNPQYYAQLTVRKASSSLKDHTFPGTTQFTAKER
jgi:hypothetical protein